MKYYVICEEIPDNMNLVVFDETELTEKERSNLRRLHGQLLNAAHEDGDDSVPVDLEEWFISEFWYNNGVVTQRISDRMFDIYGRKSHDEIILESGILIVIGFLL